jgi:hypothetical protein
MQANLEKSLSLCISQVDLKNPCECGQDLSNNVFVICTSHHVQEFIFQLGELATYSFWFRCALVLIDDKSLIIRNLAFSPK